MAGRAPPWLGWGVVALVTLDLLLVNGPVFKPAFSVRPLAHGPAQTFRQHGRSPYLQAYPRHALYPLQRHWPNATYPTLLENAGVVHSQRDLPHPRQAVPWTAPRYRGEAWSIDPRTVVDDLRLTPNSTTLDLRGAAGTVVLNHNFDRGWRVADGAAAELRAHQGLLAFNVPEGTQTIRLVFAPAAFRLGAAISAATALAATLLWLTTRRRRPRLRP